MGTTTPLNFNEYGITSYGEASQKGNHTLSILDSGNSLKVVGNGWNKIDFSYKITADTVLEFDFKSTSQGEIHGIGFDTDNIQSENRTFSLYGTQKWGNTSFSNYSQNPGTWQTYRIPVGEFYTGDIKNLFFINDHDVANPTAESIFANVRVYENLPVANTNAVPVATNAVPVAKADTLKTIEDRAITIAAANLLLNDTDANGDVLSITGVKNPYKGTVKLDGSGNITFTPYKHFVGAAGFTYTVSDGKGGTAQAYVTVNVDKNYYNFSTPSIYSYATTQDVTSTITKSSDTKGIKIVGNSWKALDLAYNITANTVVEFDFKTTAPGEVHGIGFDKDLGSTLAQLFQLAGSETTGNTTYKNYSGSNWQHYKIPVGQFYTGAMNYLVLANDHDVKNPTAESQFANLYIYEGNIGNDKPVAVDDKGTTVANAPLTLKISNLLANDTDAERDALSITSVKSVTGGTVKLDNGGNVIFTPTQGFTGQASFDYTVKDEGGDTDTGTVSVNVKSANIGINLAGISPFSSQVPFIDLFKRSNWITQSSTKWDTGEAKLLNLDENGWVKSLKGTGTSQQFTQVGALLNSSIGGKYKGGRYVVLYDGEGTLTYGFDAKKVGTLSTPGRDVIDVTPSSSGVMVRLTATDPNNNGNYLKNIRIVPIENEFNSDSQPFNPAFLEKIEPFSTFRFMDWMKTNFSSQKEWSNRPTMDDASWATKGAPVELMVELANQLDVNPWFCMPHLATDEYVTEFAKIVRDNLEPGLKVYVEYSNEVWNSTFSQYHDVEAFSSTESVYQSHGRRTTEITNIWDDVFGDDKARVIGVMGAQAANTWAAQQSLAYADDSIDAIAINPYFGSYLGQPENAKEIEGWTKDADGGLNKLFDEIMYGGVLSTGPKGGALIQGWSNTATWRNISQKYDLPIIGYEGGQHLVGVQSVVDNAAITNLFIKANRDPRMAEAYKQQMTQWYQVLGGDLFMQYSDVGGPSKWGSWGALENLSQTSTPKYDAITNFIDQHTVSAGA